MPRTDPRFNYPEPDDEQPPADANEVRRQIAERELEQLRARNKSLEQALRAASKLFAPYAGRSQIEKK